MRHPLTASIRRSISLMSAALGTAACVLALQAPAAAAAPVHRDPLVPYIVGGQQAEISQFPWQVFVMHIFVEGKTVFEATCGGSIIDATHILTAAHCVVQEGTTVPAPAEDFFVLAGASEVGEFESTLTPPPGSQEKRVSRVRADPYYTPLPGIKDDVAVLELSTPLELSPALNAQAIPLVASGATPASGTVLSLSGYGKEEGAESAQPNGKLYSTTLTAMSSDACRYGVGVNSAVLLCAAGSSSSACEGDSGGPLTQGSPPVEVGIVDFGGATCPVGRFNGFTNVAAPEVRAFIEGSETPPIAARVTSPPVIKAAGAAPADFSPLTCEPGTWSGSPSFSYTFQAENASAQVLQSGPSSTYIPPASLVGVPLVCIVQASNPGGVSTYRSATSAPVAPDSAAPLDSIAGLTCHRQACTLSVAATDPNSAALGVEPWVSYEVTTKCHVKHKKKAGKQPLCHSTAAVIMPVSNVSPGVYLASATHLPYHESITFSAVATNAAGLRGKPVIRSTKLRLPPAKQKTTHKKPKSTSRHAKH
jgi:Trypsin